MNELDWNIIPQNRLSAEQAKFAADHYFLIEEFLNQNKLSEEDWFDIVVFGYLDAVQLYYSAQHEGFSSLAFSRMRESVNKHNATSRSRETCSSSYVLEMEFKKQISLIDEMIEEIDLKTSLQYLSELEQNVLALIMQGLTPNEIHLAMGISHETYYTILQNIRAAASFYSAA